MAKKHFIIYYKNGTGTYVVTEPLPWARENQIHFPNLDFINNYPTTDVVNKYLMNNHNFIVGHEDDKISVLHNLDPNLEL